MGELYYILSQLIISASQPFEVGATASFTAALALLALHTSDVNISNVGSYVSYCSMGSLGFKVAYQMACSIPLYCKMLYNCICRSKPKAAEAEVSNELVENIPQSVELPNLDDNMRDETGPPMDAKPNSIEGTEVALSSLQNAERLSAQNNQI